jgi:hypothetical protein
MLDGVTVMGQAVKCRELIDYMKINEIFDKFSPIAEKETKIIQAIQSCIRDKISLSGLCYHVRLKYDL